MFYEFNDSMFALESRSLQLVTIKNIVDLDPKKKSEYVKHFSYASRVRLSLILLF